MAGDISVVYHKRGFFLLTNYLLWFGGNWWAGVTEMSALRSANVGGAVFTDLYLYFFTSTPSPVLLLIFLSVSLH